MNSTPDKLLLISNLNCQVEKHQLLTDINFEVDLGDFICILGKNGAGKSSLLKCIVMLFDFDGRVQLLGKSVKEYTRRALASKVGYIPQQVGSNIPYRVADFLQFSTYSNGGAHYFSNSKISGELEEILAKTGIVELKDRYLNELSGGERQKVLLASALVGKPQLLLVDEPTSFLDPKQLSEIHLLLRSLANERSMAIIAVTHEVTAALTYASKILALKEGRQIYLGSSKALTSENLKEVYDHEFINVSEKYLIPLP